MARPASVRVERVRVAMGPVGSARGLSPPVLPAWVALADRFRVAFPVVPPAGRPGDSPVELRGVPGRVAWLRVAFGLVGLRGRVLRVRGLRGEADRAFPVATSREVAWVRGLRGAVVPRGDSPGVVARRVVSRAAWDRERGEAFRAEPGQRVPGQREWRRVVPGRERAFLVELGREPVFRAEPGRVPVAPREDFREERCHRVPRGPEHRELVVLRVGFREPVVLREDSREGRDRRVDFREEPLGRGRVVLRGPFPARRGVVFPGERVVVRWGGWQPGGQLQGLVVVPAGRLAWLRRDRVGLVPGCPACPRREPRWVGREPWVGRELRWERWEAGPPGCPASPLPRCPTVAGSPGLRSRAWGSAATATKKSPTV